MDVSKVIADLATNYGSLKVISEPNGGEVFIDAKFRRKLP